MERRTFILSLAAAMAAALPAGAETIAGTITRQLERQGYSDIRVSSTLLGRLRIVARRKGGVREVIVNPNTGEVLRDLWLAEGGVGAPILSEGGSDGGRVGQRDDDDDDDDDDGDDGGEDGDGDDD